jgi:hypothetical protein
MYCHRCAFQNADSVKFCRACGANLAAVQKALDSMTPSADANNLAEAETERLLDTTHKGVRNVTIGAVLLAVSVTICIALALFVPDGVPWMLIWTVFFGWMACWGAISLAFGMGDMLGAKRKEKLRGVEAMSPRISDPPQSVTEYTTRNLDKHLSD